MKQMAKSTLLFFQPNQKKLIILLIILLFTSILFSEGKWTSKITFEEKRGMPLVFLVLHGHIFTSSRPFYCRYFPSLCRVRILDSFYIPEFLIDILFWYIVSCAIYCGAKWIIYRLNQKRINA